MREIPGRMAEQMPEQMAEQMPGQMAEPMPGPVTPFAVIVVIVVSIIITLVRSRCRGKAAVAYGTAALKERASSCGSRPSRDC